MDRLTIQERAAMLALWKAGSGSVHTILSHHQEPLPHKNTLTSTLRNLEKQGLVGHRQIGNSYEYFLVVSKTAFTRQNYKQLLNHFFDNKVENLLSFIARDKKLSEEDIEQIRAIINKH